MKNLEEIYEVCYMIRSFEKKIEEEFERGTMRGTTHGCIGQEVIPAVVMLCIDRKHDYITGTHRCHGQILAYTKDPYRLACEMMGKRNGFNYGMGGSQHIKIEHYITNGVTGGMASVGCGMALSLKKNCRAGIVISFLGDGGFQEGYFQETLNMAQVYQVPILYVLENNNYAMSTRTSVYSSGTVANRVQAINMKYFFANARDIEKLYENVQKAYTYVKENKRPAFIEVDTFRLCGHSKSDLREYMSEEEKMQNKKDDPIIGLKQILPRKISSEIEKRIDLLIEDAFFKAKDSEEIGIDQYQRGNEKSEF